MKAGFKATTIAVAVLLLCGAAAHPLFKFLTDNARAENRN
jgi:hypothetical protein